LVFYRLPITDYQFHCLSDCVTSVSDCVTSVSDCRISVSDCVNRVSMCDILT
jgi:hypothetical protein